MGLMKAGNAFMQLIHLNNLFFFFFPGKRETVGRQNTKKVVSSHCICLHVTK